MDAQPACCNRRWFFLLEELELKQQLRKNIGQITDQINNLEVEFEPIPLNGNVPAALEGLFVKIEPQMVPVRNDQGAMEMAPADEVATEAPAEDTAIPEAAKQLKRVKKA